MELKFNNSSKYFQVIFVSHHIFAEYSGGSFNDCHVLFWSKVIVTVRLEFVVKIDQLL